MQLLSTTTAIALIACVCALVPLIWLAPQLQLLDYPDHRKKHQAATPVVGGIALYIALVFTAFVTDGSGFSWSFLAWLGSVLLVGVLDDRYDVSHQLRLAFHAVVVMGIVWTDQLMVINIGEILGTSEIHFKGFYGVLFTVFAVVGAVNAVNMIDGVDGLLASLGLSSVAVIFGLVLMNDGHGLQNSPVGTAAFIGSLAGFLILNSRILFKSAKVFLGDSGSTVVGFVLVYLLIFYSQGHDRVFSPVLAGWLLGLPLVDASAVIVTRFITGRSLFKPDRSHLHHQLLDSGRSVNKTVLMMLGMHIPIMLTGVLISALYGSWAEFILFWGFVGLVGVRVVMSLKGRAASNEDDPDLVVGRKPIKDSIRKAPGVWDDAKGVDKVSNQ